MIFSLVFSLQIILEKKGCGNYLFLHECAALIHVYVYFEYLKWLPWRESNS